MSNPFTYPSLRTMAPKRKKGREHGNSLEDLLFTEPFHGARPEQSIWRAVILQNITDALSQSQKRENMRYKREALAWLTGKSRDFRTVCEYAGYDPDYIHDKIHALFATHSQKVQCQRKTPPSPKASEHFSLSFKDAKAHFGSSLPTISEQEENAQ